jgi:hypothetical protein
MMDGYDRRSAKLAEAANAARRQCGVTPQACCSHDAKRPEAAPAIEACK